MFSKATEYALRATIFIAQKSSIDNKLVIETIAEAIDSPKSFTAKIMQSLTKNNCVISSMRGPNGGFYITESAKKLPVRAVLKAMGESGMLDKCVLGLKQCSGLNPCPMHHEYKTIKHELICLFENKTIQELADDLVGGDAFLSNKKVK